MWNHFKKDNLLHSYGGTCKQFLQNIKITFNKSDISHSVHYSYNHIHQQRHIIRLELIYCYYVHQLQYMTHYPEQILCTSTSHTHTHTHKCTRVHAHEVFLVMHIHAVAFRWHHIICQVDVSCQHPTKTFSLHHVATHLSDYKVKIKDLFHMILHQLQLFTSQHGIIFHTNLYQHHHNPAHNIKVLTWDCVDLFSTSTAIIKNMHPCVQSSAREKLNYKPQAN
jgi:hypothetical protein